MRMNQQLINLNRFSLDNPGKFARYIMIGFGVLTIAGVSIRNHAEQINNRDLVRG